MPQIMIKDKEFLFWPIFVRLIEWFWVTNVSIRKYKSNSRSSYVINNKIWLFIKTSTSRNGPRNFTFMREHQEEIQELKNSLENVFLILICNEDWIVSLSFDDVKKILDYDHIDVEWIRVQRKKWEKYTVYWHDWELKRKIWDNEFPKKILDLI